MSRSSTDTGGYRQGACWAASERAPGSTAQKVLLLFLTITFD